jgi:AcrR family transcriptional regulator
MQKKTPAKLGRPRDKAIEKAILRAALDLVSAQGFRAITVDQIAAEAGVGKMTLYRRWPNKAALVMDALLQLIGPETEFPDAPDALTSLERQLHLQGKFFCSRYGRLIRTLVAEAQSDKDLASAFRERWLTPRRKGVLKKLKDAIATKQLRKDIDLEATIDMLYGPIYYRLLLGTGAIDTTFINRLYKQFLLGHDTHEKQ